MMTPLSQDDANIRLRPPGRTGQLRPAVVAFGFSDVAPVTTSRLGRFVWLLFASGCLVPLLVFMGFQYRRLAVHQIDTLSSAMIQAARIVQSDLEQHVATRFDFLEHMILHLERSSVSSDQEPNEARHRSALIHEAGTLGFASFLAVDRSGTIVTSWPADQRTGDRLPIGDANAPAWVTLLGRSMETGERFCAPPETGHEASTDSLAHICAPIRDEAGQIIGAATGLLRSGPFLVSQSHEGGRIPNSSAYLRSQDFILPLWPSSVTVHDPVDDQKTQGERFESWPSPIIAFRDSMGHVTAGLRTRLDAQVFRGGVWHLFVSTDLTTLYAQRKEFVRSAAVFVVFTLMLIGILTYVLTHETVVVVRHYLHWARDAALGRISAIERPHGQHELAELGQALSDLSFRLRDLTNLGTALSSGNPGRPLRVVDEEDQLGRALNGVRDYFGSLTATIDRITSGRFVPGSQAVSPSDQLGQKLMLLSESLNRMNEGNMRLISATYAQMELARQMGAEQNFSALVTGILDFVCRQVKAKTGVLYVVDSESVMFARVGTWGGMADDYPERIVAGERLAGQAIRDQKPLLAPPMPLPSVGIESGLVREQAVSVLAFPFVLRNEVIAVIELAGLQEFKPDHLDFIKKNNESIAIAIHLAQARNLTETLLRKTVEQSESLRYQQEQLSTANRELADQAEALRQSETRLMARETELEDANRELAAHTRRLEDQKRFLDLKNRELEATQSILESKAEELTRSNRYKSEFLANMSHELRTPLNSIILLSQTLRDKLGREPGNPLVKFAEIINAAGRDLLSLIDDVLDLTKLSSGDMARTTNPYALRDIERVLKFWFGKIALEKNIAFDIVWTDPLPTTIFTDPTKLEKILKSLLSNAFKYTSTGRVSVEIRRPDPDSPLPDPSLRHDRTVEFLITDTGEGIPEAMKAVIFDAFKQGDGTITRKHGGTGLGLALAQEFARLLRGDIRLVRSDEGGSAFSLFIPDGEPAEGETP
jgi:signal transduction histidine kinase